MHHFIYPSADSYITNRNGFENKNFGIDEILQIGTTNQSVRNLNSTRNYVYSNEIFNSISTTYFTGIFSGSILGTSLDSNGYISGSNLVFSVSYFSGDIDGVRFDDYSGSIMGSAISGSMSGSFIFPTSIGLFIGQLTGSTACLIGTGSGVDTRQEYNWSTDVTKYIDRTLIKFDITEISKSISIGDINNPKFGLKLKVCNEQDLPINYVIYALPISQSWNMGDGYYSDGGSDLGVSWTYRDNNYETNWYSGSITGIRSSIDFITNPALSTASFKYGGGTWYTSSICSQSFSYESSDINMDITPIVNSWLTRQIPNEGILLIHSDELYSTGSGFILKFYSRDTNTIYSPHLDVKWIGNSNGLSTDFSTGSFSTGSVNISYLTASFNMFSTDRSTFISASSISGSFSGSAFLKLYPVDTILSASGFVDARGLTGNIAGFPVNGGISASIESSQSAVTGPCGKTFYAQLATGSFYTGNFSGSTFTAFYVDYKFENGILNGIWNSSLLSGARVILDLPSTIDPYTYATITSSYISSRALGTYSIYNSTSSSFDGQIIDGHFLGSSVNLQLTGSYISQSYYYTSSVELTSSQLNPLIASNPFSINVNVNPTYKAGDIIKVYVFSRKQVPLKTFDIANQLSAYTIPEYLPETTYYSLKDNQSDETIIDFDDYTTLSCEYPAGNYFIIDTTSLAQERYYRILIKIKYNSQIYTIDTGKTFKIIR